MKKLLFLFLLTSGLFYKGVSQNLLAIPDTLSGTQFNLVLHDTSHYFYPGMLTQTYGVNASYLGPTLFFNRGDSVVLNVNNQLMDTTTIHWHGLHVSAMNDGGPHITVPPGTTWSPAFKVRDHAATYWYHPHLHMMTNLHATLGAAGLIIVRDSAEAQLNLPRKYGVDDFPLVIQSKCFDAQKQIVVGNASDSAIMVNGTIDAYLPVPAQVNRFRILNASSERVYFLGLPGNLAFYQIAGDGGLLDAPVALTRLRLAPGERAEILIDFSNLLGQSINLMSYGSELPGAIYGAAQPGMGPGQTIPGYTSNVLNGANFVLMSFNVVAQTANPVLGIPSALIPGSPWNVASANAFRSLTFSPVNMGPTAIQGPFLINNTSFDMGVVNYSIPLNNVEVWTLTNQSPIAHPFHIHDVQFYITEINGAAPPPNLAGRKDVVLVPAMQTVKFITKFETFCDSMGMYMYHCHMLPHEDDGMMGQFGVTCPATTSINESSRKTALTLSPNPADDLLFINLEDSKPLLTLKVMDAMGKLIVHEKNPSGNKLRLHDLPNGIYFLFAESEDNLWSRSFVIQHH